MRSPLITSLWSIVVLCFTSTIAMACPYCAGREENSGELILMFSMILLPFGIAGVVYKVIKRVAVHEELTQSSDGPVSGENS